MPRWAISILVFPLGLAIAAQSLSAQQPENERKVTSRVVPTYPELAKAMHLEGKVKLQVTVAPNGNPKFVEAVGGSPLLVKAAQETVYKWRWAPSPHESKELVEVRFHPE
jgi:TonB family protein